MRKNNGKVIIGILSLLLLLALSVMGIFATTNAKKNIKIKEMQQ